MERNRIIGAIKKIWLCGNSCRSMKGVFHITLGGVFVAMLIPSDVDDKDNDSFRFDIGLDES